MTEIIPAVLAAKAGRRLGDIAILYKDFHGGNAAAAAAMKAGLSFSRVDNAAPYKKVALTSWIEDCAGWCAGGWRNADPQLRTLISRWIGFHGNLRGSRLRAEEGERLTRFLWERRQDDAPAAEFVQALCAELVDDLIRDHPSLSDQAEQVENLYAALGHGSPLASFLTADLGRQDGSPDHLNLLTFTPPKGVSTM